MVWLLQFIDELVSPKFAAQALVAFSTTALSLAVAGTVFLRQIQHDRQLFENQLLADRLRVGAERRASAANRLGKALLHATGEFTRTDDESLESDLRRAHANGADCSAPGVDQISAAYEAARLELELDSSIALHLKHRTEWWNAVAAATRQRQYRRLRKGPRVRVLRAVLAVRFDPADDSLRDLGRRLIDWDGGSAVVQSSSRRLIANSQPPTLSVEQRLGLIQNTGDSREIKMEVQRVFQDQILRRPDARQKERKYGLRPGFLSPQ